MTIPAFDGDFLPPGRHTCTPKELEVAFVSAAAFADSVSRRGLWGNWERALALLESAVTVYTAWVGGSFTTTKRNPRDIDVTFLVSAEDWAQRGTTDRQIVESFMTRVRDPLTGRIGAPHGLLIDSFVEFWSPHQPTAPPRTPEYQNYLSQRGYWDDWWSRRRTSSKKAPPVRADTFPVRGYVEVNIHDFA